MFRIRYVLFLMATLSGSVVLASDDQAIVKKVVAEQLKVDQSIVGADTALHAIGKGADSLDVIEIMMAIERTLHVDISDKNVAAVIGSDKTDDLPKTTVRQLTKMVSIARQPTDGH